MTPKQLEHKTIPELAKMIDRRAEDILIIGEQIMFFAEPQTEDAMSDLTYFKDFLDAVERVGPYLNEMIGDKP